MIKVIYYTFKKDLKSSLRSKQLIFWAFIFPLLIIFVFSGLIKNNNIKYSIILVNKDKGNISKYIFDGMNKSGLFTFKNLKNLSEAKKLLQKSSYDAIIYVPENFSENIKNMKRSELIVYLNMKNPSWAQTTLGVISAMIERINAQITNRTINISLKYIPETNHVPFKNQNNITFKEFVKNYLIFISKPIQLKVEKYNTGKTYYRQSIVYSMIAMDVVIIGMLLSSVLLTKEIEKRTIRRFTFNKKLFVSFLLSKVLVTVFIMLLAMITLFLVSLFIFKIKFTISNPLYPVAMFLIATLFMASIGILLSLLLKDSERASAIALTMGMILSFTSGVFIPFKLLPKPLQDLSWSFPPTIVLNNIYSNIYAGLNSLSLTNIKNIYVISVSIISLIVAILISIIAVNKMEF